MGVEDGNSDKQKIRRIEWKGALRPDEVAQRNNEEAERRGIARRGERNKDALLAGIDKALIQLGRRNAERIVQETAKDDLIQSEKMMDDVIRSYHPKKMIAILVGLDERSRIGDPILYAAMAQSFLALTEGY